MVHVIQHSKTYNVYTVIWEIFSVENFSDSMGSAKIKRTNIMRIINTNAVRGRLSKKYLTRKLITRNIPELRYII